MRVHVGPFGVMDQVGLKTVWTILDFWAKELNDQQATANANFVKQYVDKGHLGAKTKQGFYSYPNPAYTHANFLSGENRKTS
jgi:3-hydroxybutyryl-CoA dehydrogenase